MKKALLLLVLSFIIIQIESCELIEEEDISNEEILIYSPANQDTLTTGSVSFWWEFMAGANAYELRLVSPNFDRIDTVLYDSLFSNNLVSIKLDSGQYAWRITALNASYLSKTQERLFWMIPETNEISDPETGTTP